MSKHEFMVCDPSCAKCGCHTAPPPCPKPKPPCPCACSKGDNKMSLLGWLVIGVAIWYFFFAGDDVSCTVNCLLDLIRPCRKKPPEERFYKVRLPTSPQVLQMYRHE
ncbi:uncharacterized protein LOC123673067 [Harmonia axyridis]|uniref:uncharacterized protein LOC123673067 n=1 Tax=Harmonia axyridis TaxID=115357 RepID=UPI001E277CAE|nr:uncharacterized protein LOC123673067 [Harmonia axyridis]